MNAARRNAKRAAAQSQPDPFPLVTQEQRDALHKRAWQFCKHNSALGNHRARRAKARELADAAIAEMQQRAEAANRRVQPVAAGGGLVRPQSSLIITPEQARQLAQRR